MTDNIRLPETIEHVGVDAVLAYAKNSRTHSADQVAAVARSIRAYGFTNPILIHGATIIAGHGRVMAAKQIGLATVPAIRLDHLTEAEARAYVIADNRLAELAGWDEAILAEELRGLQGEGFDLSLTGWEGKELDELLFEPPAAKTGADDAPPVREEAKTKAGDVWVLGKHRVMCGDSTSVEQVQVLMAGDRADFCFTSPPYNSAMKGGGRLGKNQGKGFYGDGYTDNLDSAKYVDFNRKIFAAMATIAADQFTCCYNINYNKNSPSEYLDVAIAGREYFPLVETIGWEKIMAISLQGNNLTRIFEFIFVYASGEMRMNKEKTECERNLWRVNNVGANHDIHKAAFPIELVQRGLDLFAPRHGVVFEPFCGSGSTLIACEQTGRINRSMELDPKYCDVIVRRWQNFTGQRAINAVTGEPFGD